MAAPCDKVYRLARFRQASANVSTDTSRADDAIFMPLTLPISFAVLHLTRKRTASLLKTGW